MSGEEFENEISEAVSPWDEGDADVESLMGAELSNDEVRASFDDDDEDLSGELEDLTEDDLQEDVESELRSASWHVAPSLIRLRNEINKRWPRRDKASDGSIGDAAHSSRASDHNPNGRRSVNAIDIDKDGISAMTVVNAAKKHPACNYVIFNRVIYSRSRGFRGVRYNGSNPHNHHIHVSIRQTSAAEKNTKSWGISSGSAPAPAPAPAKPVASYPALQKELKRGMSGGQVDDLQKRLKARGWDVTVDNDFGPGTEKVVRQYQKEKKLVVDGIVGKATWKSIWTSKVT